MLLHEEAVLLGQNHQILQPIFVTEIHDRCVDFKGVNHRLYLNEQGKKLSNAEFWKLVKEHFSFSTFLQPL